MTKKDGKYARISFQMTYWDKEDIRSTAFKCGKTMSQYLLDLHHNAKDHSASRKEPNEY